MYPAEIRCQSAHPTTVGGDNYQLNCPFCREALKIHLNGIATLQGRCNHYDHISVVSYERKMILVEFHQKGKPC